MGNSKFLSCDCFLLDFYFGSSLFAAGKRDGDFCAAWTDSFDLSVGINGGNFFCSQSCKILLCHLWLVRLL